MTEKSAQPSFREMVDTKKVIFAKSKGFTHAQPTSKAVVVEAVPSPPSNEVVEVEEALLQRKRRRALDESTP